MQDQLCPWLSFQLDVLQPPPRGVVVPLADWPLGPVAFCVYHPPPRGVVVTFHCAIAGAAATIAAATIAANAATASVLIAIDRNLSFDWWLGSRAVLHPPPRPA